MTLKWQILDSGLIDSALNKLCIAALEQGLSFNIERMREIINGEVEKAKKQIYELLLTYAIKDEKGPINFPRGPWVFSKEEVKLQFEEAYNKLLETTFELPVNPIPLEKVIKLLNPSELFSLAELLEPPYQPEPPGSHAPVRSQISSDPEPL